VHGDVERKKDESGLWIVSSLFNHEFVPNVIWSAEGRVQRMAACADIQAGTELTICYRQPETMSGRQTFLEDYSIPLVGPLWERREDIVVLEKLLEDLDTQYKETLALAPGHARNDILQLILEAIEDLNDEFGDVIADDFIQSNVFFQKVQVYFSLEQYDACLEAARTVMDIESRSRSILEKWMFELKNVLLGAGRPVAVDARVRRDFEASLETLGWLRFGSKQVAKIIFETMTFSK
jgi:hypothetical protein